MMTFSLSNDANPIRKENMRNNQRKRTDSCRCHRHSMLLASKRVNMCGYYSAQEHGSVHAKSIEGIKLWHGPFWIILLARRFEKGICNHIYRGGQIQTTCDAPKQNLSTFFGLFWLVQSGSLSFARVSLPAIAAFHHNWFHHVFMRLGIRRRCRRD
jgi:hypothetical protein